MNGLAPVSATQDHIQGPLDAGIVLIEYGDFECPYCGAAFPEPKAVKEKMGERPLLRLSPFSATPGASPCRASCGVYRGGATIGKFWEMHDMFYENHEALTDWNLISYAKRLGLEPKLIESALGRHFASRVQREFSSGVRSGVNGTPCLFLNGERYDGLRDASSLIELMHG